MLFRRIDAFSYFRDLIVEQADLIDEIASNSPGFVSQPNPPDADSIYRFPELLNLSVWESVESLRAFTFAGKHAAALKRRAEWFVQKEKHNYVFYWDQAGKPPMESEIQKRFEYLRAHGPTPYAFTFEMTFSPEQALSFSPE